MKTKDEPIAEIREIRYQISQEFDNDPKKYTNYLKIQEEKYRDQIKSYQVEYRKYVDRHVASQSGLTESCILQPICVDSRSFPGDHEQ